MHKGCVHDFRLVACAHAKILNPAQVRKGRVSDHRLVTSPHDELLDLAQTHEWLQPHMTSFWIPRRCTNAASVTLLQSLMFTVCSRARSSPRIWTKSASTIGFRRPTGKTFVVTFLSPFRYIDRTCCWKSRTPCPHTAPEYQSRAHTREIHDSLTKFLADKPQCV